MPDSRTKTNKIYAPRNYVGVMVSSTFTDLKNHREALIRAINRQELKPVAMEFDSAKPTGDVIDSSLRMVRDSAAYVGVISHKYGQIPECPHRNPNGLSLMELEFNEARSLGRSVLIFIMGDDHDVKAADVEKDPDKVRKLTAFRENAKRLSEDSSVLRVYKLFNNLSEFEVAATQSIADLRRLLDQENKFKEGTSVSLPAETVSRPAKLDSAPIAPALYASPPYIGSHAFVGRATQLETLSEWSMPSDSHPLFLYEGIGGSGKSILAWEWTTNHAVSVRDEWAGRFWYSFYEKGATMVDFCRKALAYMTGEPRAFFREKNTAELTEPLINQLLARPHLVILDGLERILVSYHRFDAAQVPDEHAGKSDLIAERDPCATINPEDEDLLRAFAVASPSKILMTSRLVPRALLNRSGQPIPGALRERLPGLRPMDAELLIRSAGVVGTSSAIQNYLKSHCDCHPLVIGVLAGLITDYLPDRGNFDAWVADPLGGGRLNLANLNLVQKRNHILTSALIALPESESKLIATLALLSESIDYPTLCALNPDLSSLPEAVEPPKDPTKGRKWKKESIAEQTRAREEYETELKRYQHFMAALEQRDYELQAANAKLAETVKDLERRGLLQYDSLSKRYDLHPVVRGCAVGGLKHEDVNRYGQRVVDYFSQKVQNPYDEAESLADFENARRIVKALFQMGKLEQARDFILDNNFLEVLNKKFEAHNEILTVVRPFFSQDWAIMPRALEKRGGISLAKRAAVALRRISALHESFVVSEMALKTILKNKREDPLASHLLNLSSTAGELNRLALEDHLLRIAGGITSLYEDLTPPRRRNTQISYWLARFRQLSIIGDFDGALEMWSKLNENWLSVEECAIAAHHYAVHLLFCDALTEEALANAEDLNHSIESALGKRNLCALRGFWSMEKNDWQSARDNLQEAIALAHKAGKFDRRSEIRLAIANYHLGKLPHPDHVADGFALNVDGQCLRALAEFWLSIGNDNQARQFAIAAYRWAWADGEPFVHRYEINKTKMLLKQLGMDLPALRSFDSATLAPLVWENDLNLFIEQLQTKVALEKAARETEQTETKARLMMRKADAEERIQ